MHSKKSVAKLTLLRVDDSADDRTLVREAIALTNTPFHYEEADGLATAIAYFEFRNRKTRRLPALVILDYALGNLYRCRFPSLASLREENDLPASRNA